MLCVCVTYAFLKLTEFFSSVYEEITNSKIRVKHLRFSRSTALLKIFHRYTGDNDDLVGGREESIVS